MPGGPAKGRSGAQKEKESRDDDVAEEATDKSSKGKTAANSCRVACRRSVQQLARTIARIIDYGVRAFHVIMKIIGPCFICLALGLIGFCTYTYFLHLLPTLEAQYGIVGKIGFTVLGLFLVSNTLYNYGSAVMTDPGLPPDFDQAIVDREANQPPPKQCKHCSRLKPPRAHHCSVCGRCVLKMDHHCPWINNCVGFGNYRHFCLFMLFLGMSCVFVVFTFFPVFYDGFFNMRHRRIKLTRDARSCIMTSFMIASSILVAICILGGFHIFLVLTNQTTIEFQLNMLHRREARKNGEYFRNPYDMGRRRNFQQVFGPSAFCKLRWLMPYLAQSPTGDGMNFTSISGLKI